MYCEESSVFEFTEGNVLSRPSIPPETDAICAASFAPMLTLVKSCGVPLFWKITSWMVWVRTVSSFWEKNMSGKRAAAKKVCFFKSGILGTKFIKIN